MSNADRYRTEFLAWLNGGTGNQTGQRGRPHRPMSVEIFAWCLVELKRDREPPRHGRQSVRAASETLADILSKDGVKNVSAATLRRLHRDCEQKWKKEGMTPAGIARQRDELLREPRDRRLLHGWQSDLRVLLGIF